MGTACQSTPESIRQFPPVVPVSKRAQNLSIRFGNVSKMNLANPIKKNLYSFVMQEKNGELIKVSCCIVKNYSDILSLQTQVLRNPPFTSLSQIPPIVDPSDTSQTQTLLQIETNQSDPSSTKQTIGSGSNQNMLVFSGKNYCLKMYTFQNYNDPLFKNGIYELYLHELVRKGCNYNNGALAEFFIVQKTKPFALVFVYRGFKCTLANILTYRRSANMPYTKDQQDYLTYNLLTRYRNLQINNIVHRDIRPQKIYISPQLGLGYELANLQSSRQLSLPDQNLYLSVKGIPEYCSPQVKDLHLQTQPSGTYNALTNDRYQLAKVIEEVCFGNNNKDVGKVVHELKGHEKDITQILRQFTIATGNRKMAMNIMQTDLKILNEQLPKLMKQELGVQKISEIEQQFLMTLNHRQLLFNKLTAQMQNNWYRGQKWKNIEILDKAGHYYERLGEKGNQFYKEEIAMLVERAEQQRLTGFQSQEGLKKADQIIFEKFDNNLNHPQTQANLQLQKAYSALEKNDVQTADNLINNILLKSASSSKIPPSTQSSLLLCKGKISVFKGQPVESYNLFNKGLELANVRNNFVTEVEQLQHKAKFLGALAELKLMQIQKNRQKRNPQDFAQCQDLLQQARVIWHKIPEKNSAWISKIYQDCGDFHVQREDFVEASSSYEKAYNLQASSEIPISTKQKTRLLSKVLQFHKKHSQDPSLQQKVSSLLSQLSSPAAATRRRPTFPKPSPPSTNLSQKKLGLESRGLLPGGTQGSIVEVEEEWRDTSR